MLVAGRGDIVAARLTRTEGRDASVAFSRPYRTVDEVVKRWSPRFYELLRTTTAEENARLAQAGTLVLQIQGRVLRITD